MWIVIFDDKREKRIDVFGRAPSKVILFASYEAAKSLADDCRGVPDSEVLIAEISRDGSAVVVELIGDKLEIIGETVYQSRKVSDGRLRMWEPSVGAWGLET